MSNKKERLEFRDRLIQFANDLGFDVELDAVMEDHLAKYQEQVLAYRQADKIDDEQMQTLLQEESRPAGDCNYLTRRIRVREGKGLNGQVSTLIHELCHALGLGGESLLSLAGSVYNELACESITEFVTTALGIDRTEQTSRRILGYGFGGYLLSPVTATYTRIILENIGIDPTTWGPSDVSTD